MNKRTGLVHPDDAGVKLEPGPGGVTTAKVSRLKALGLPTKCVGGEIVEDSPLDAGVRWCVFRSDGGMFGFAYERGSAPFGKATTIELTIMDAYDDGTLQQSAA
jgi:hypothetical protein